jgi:peptidoglycan/LPS O-acetylase OafA/YrhL
VLNRREQLPYLQPLDGLRAVAAILVLLMHARLPYSGGGGLIGVGTFFVLSGFLITRLLVHEYEQEGRIDYLAFQWRRFARIVPLVILFVLVFLLVQSHLFPKAKPLAEIIPVLFFYKNYAVMFAKTSFVLGHMWSVAVEVQFYLIWPVILAGLLTLYGRSAATSLAVLALAFLAWRWGLRILAESGFYRSYFSFENSAASLVLGAWLAVAMKQAVLSARFANILGIASVIIFAGIMVQDWAFIRRYNVHFLTANDLASIAMIAAILTHSSIPSRLLSAKIFIPLGAWSYGIYVWHYPIARVARDNLPGVYSAAVVLLVTLVLAALSYYFFERPMRQLLNGWFAAWRAEHPQSRFAFRAANNDQQY